MTIATVPPATVAANRDAVTHLLGANQYVKGALSASREGDAAQLRSITDGALLHADTARSGLQSLTPSTNLLPDATHAHANHVVRDLQRAVQLLDARHDVRSQLERHLAQAEISSRLGYEAGLQALDSPSLRPRSAPIPTEGGPDDRGSFDDGGSRLDGQGNPMRGTHGWVGPDGVGLGAGEFSGGSDGAWVGPDGVSFSGV